MRAAQCQDKVLATKAVVAKRVYCTLICCCDCIAATASLSVASCSSLAFAMAVAIACTTSPLLAGRLNPGGRFCRSREAMVLGSPELGMWDLLMAVVRKAAAASSSPKVCCMAIWAVCWLMPGTRCSKLVTA